LKFNRIIRWVSVIFTTVLLGASLPTPAMAAGQPVLNVTPAFGPVGTEVEVQGSYFEGNQIYFVCIADESIALNAKISNAHNFDLLGNLASTSTGSFSKKIIIPSKFREGSAENIEANQLLYIYIAVESGNDFAVKGSAEFSVTGEVNISLSDPEGFVDSELKIEGVGFWPGEQIEVYFDGYDITNSYFAGEPKAASPGIGAGSFSVTVPVPDAVYGDKEVKIVGKTSGAEVVKNFKVLPHATFSPTEGSVGTKVLVAGTGFKNGAYVEIYLGNTFLKTTERRVSNNGSFSEIVTIPEGTAPGTYVIEAIDVTNDDIYARADFEVKIYLEPAITTLDADEWTVGSTVTIGGVEFNNNKNITLTIDGEDVDPDATIKSTSTGTFSGSFTIPELPAGTHTLKASDGTVEATATFTVAHKAEIDKTSGKAGDTVTVTGTGFKAGTAVVINFGGDTNVAPTGAKTDAKGSFSASFTVPAVAEGTHNVKISVGSDSVTKTFTSSISMTLLPESGKSGMEVVVTAEGLEPGATASVYFGTTKLSSADISDQGKLSFVFNVPVAAEGAHSVKIEVNGITVSRDFTISADATFTPTSGKVGDDISITGSGFGSAKPLTLTWDGKAVGDSTGLAATAEGTFNITFKVPAVKGGSYVISISDGTITKTQTFTVEASAPPVPQPISPALASKEKGNVTFEWKPVIYDIMGFTYQLQVSKDSTFASMLIDKTGLTTTNYSLTDSEKLDKTGSDAPYYWRVRAVDEAGNEGDWTSNANFTVGGGWPGWLTWVLIGLGVVVLGILAFWVGRRIAYYSY